MISAHFKYAKNRRQDFNKLYFVQSFNETIARKFEQVSVGRQLKMRPLTHKNKNIW